MAARTPRLDEFGGDFGWSLFDAAPDAILVVSDVGAIAFANNQAASMFETTIEGLIGRNVDELVPDEVRGRHEAHRMGYQGHPGVRTMGVGLHLRARRPNGSEFDVEISLSPLLQGPGTFVVAAVRDITDRLAAEAELAESRERLRQAEQAVLLADDRDRIARDLHDTVIQRLFAAGLSLQAVAARSGDAQVRARLESTVDDLDATIKELRSTIFSLQTPVAGPGGLRGRLLDVASEGASATGLEPRIVFDGPVEVVPERIAEHVVPTLREALSNVTHHAQATTVEVEVVVAEDRLVLTVVDDGVGISDSSAGGHGLANMTRRAEELGGTLTVEPGTGGGTRLTWSAPLTPD